MNRYIAFLKVFERNSFSDAARDLGYTQSAVSQMIKSLEEELGVTLLVRSRSGVALTYEGRHLLPYIRDTVNAYRMLQSQAAGFSGLEQGTIRLGTFTSVSSYLLPPAMERFRRLHSGIRFELYQGLYYEIEDWVREGVVDFGFTDMLRTIPFPCEPIYQDTMLVVLPEGHPLGENIFIQVDELAAEPFILLEEGRGGGCIRDLLTRHPQINVQYRVADDYTILNLVENNLGVSILPEAVLRRSGRRVIARRLPSVSSTSRRPACPPPDRCFSVSSRRRSRTCAAEIFCARVFTRPPGCAILNGTSLIEPCPVDDTLFK